MYKYYIYIYNTWSFKSTLISARANFCSRNPNLLVLPISARGTARFENNHFSKLRSFAGNCARLREIALVVRPVFSACQAHQVAYNHQTLFSLRVEQVISEFCFGPPKIRIGPRHSHSQCCAAAPLAPSWHRCCQAPAIGANPLYG